MSNKAAIGYMILAAKDCDIPDQDIRDIASMMLECMDYKTEEYAEELYIAYME